MLALLQLNYKYYTIIIINIMFLVIYSEDFSKLFSVSFYVLFEFSFCVLAVNII
jgi:hypothetical protein